MSSTRTPLLRSEPPGDLALIPISRPRICEECGVAYPQGARYRKNHRKTVAHVGISAQEHPPGRQRN